MNRQPLAINQLIDDAHQNAKAHGWHEPERSFGELIALCHSELSEALEEYRDGKPEVYYRCQYHDTRTGCPDRFDGCQYGENSGCNKRKPEGIAVELADVVIRIADMCGLYGIDLEAAIAEKMEYNKSRPMRHGGKVL